MSRKYPRKYQAPASLGFFALLCIASPALLKLPSQFKAFNVQTELDSETAISKANVFASEDLERARIQQKKETADKLKETGVMPSGGKYKIRNYYDDPKRDPNPNATGHLEDEVVYVYDSAGICIGKIQNRKWLWKHYFKGVCDAPPAQ